MYNYQIMMLFIAIPFVGLAILYLFAKRKTMNLLCKIIPAWNKRYVICHMRYQGGLSDVFNVVPSLTGLTEVGKYSYLLMDKYKALTFNKRYHFILDEADSIPKNFEIQNKESIIFQSAEIKTALENTVMEYLFSKKKEMLIIGLFLVAIISIIAIIYMSSELSSIKQILQNSIITIQETKDVMK